MFWSMVFTTALVGPVTGVPAVDKDGLEGGSGDLGRLKGGEGGISSLMGAVKPWLDLRLVFSAWSLSLMAARR